MFIYLLFTLAANGVLPDGSGTYYTHPTKKHNTLKQNTSHETTQTMKDTPHTVNAMQIQLKLQQIQLQ
jgi:hypothetical protein